MLIRHISIPKNSHLITLKEPRQKPQTNTDKDFTEFFNRTLNPQSPSHDALFINAENNRIKGKSINRMQNINKRQNGYLGRETPVLLNQYLSNQDILPQREKIRFNQEVNKRNQRSNYNEIYTNPHNFSTYTPPLNKNAYLIKPQPQSTLSHQNQNIFQNNGQNQKEEEQTILTKHQSKLVKNSQLYKTLQRFKPKRLVNEGLQQNKIEFHKKYAYSLPKQIFSQSNNNRKESQIQEPDAKIEKKSFRSKQIHLAPNTTSPIKIQRKKNSLPRDDSLQKNIKYIQPNTQRIHKKSEPEVVVLNNKQELDNQSLLKVEKITKYFEATQPSQTKIEISYRTSLAKLKQICCAQALDKYIVTMKIPEIFAYPMFTGNQEQDQLFTKAEEILRNLQVQFKTDIQLKKYTNCVSILVNRISIIWHYSGKVYFGGWKNQIFDQGCKEGLGLQWSPKKYVYYGQYYKNKRCGMGIMKNNDNQIFAGLWRDNHFIRSLLNSQEQLQSKLFSIIK